MLLGGLLGLHWPRAAWLHLPACGWGTYVEFSGRLCPLTAIENALRMAAGQRGYAGGFIEHYLLPLIYPAGLTRDLQAVFGSIVVGLTVVVYTWAWRRRCAHRVR